MDNIVLHHYAHDTGVYLGSAQCPPRPRGVGLPANSTLDPPPDGVPDGHVARWTGEGWEVVPAPGPPPPLYGYDESGICTGPLLPGQLPERATELPPPDPEPGAVAVWDGQAWSVVEDHRGRDLYSTVDGSAVVMNAIGPVPEGFTLKPFPGTGWAWSGDDWTPDLPTARATRCSEVDTLRDSLLRSGYAFEFGGEPHALQTRGEDDRLNWLGVLAACQAMVAAGQGEALLSIRTAANDTLAVPAAGLAQVLLGALAHQSAIYAAAWAHKDAIRLMGEDSGGVTAVLGYDITTGWPG